MGAAHSPRGKPLDQGLHFYAWREVRAAAGLRSFRWHDWRRFCATQLLELGLDHFAVSVQLGHTDGGALVMARYGHPSEGPRDNGYTPPSSSTHSSLVARLVAAELHPAIEPNLSYRPLLPQ
jgi:Phage integrase family